MQPDIERAHALHVQTVAAQLAAVTSTHKAEGDHSTSTATAHIEPGHPWENGYVESFNGKYRDECLNAEIFWPERQAQVVVERWRRQYNEERPHSAPGYRTPPEWR